MKIAHLTHTTVENESRIIKESLTLLSQSISTEVQIFGTHSRDLKENEWYDENILIKRIVIRTRKLRKIYLFQIIKYLEFLCKLIFSVIKERPNLIIIHSLALLPCGILLKFVLKTDLVYDAHELETEVFGLGGWKKFVYKVVEKFLIKFCTLVVVVTDSINAWYKKEYRLTNIITVKNCPFTFKNSNKKSSKFHEVFSISKERKILLYQGGIDYGRGVEELLNIFSLNAPNSIDIVFMGYGELSQTVKIASEVHSNIHLHPPVSPEIMHDYTGSADIGIAFISNGSLNDQFCLPNKLFEYLMYGIPVIVNANSDMENVVRQWDVGYILNNLIAAELNEVLYSYLNDDWHAKRSHFEKFSAIHCWEHQGDILVAGLKAHIRRN